METDLLVNPKLMGGVTNLESIDLPTLDFADIGSEAPAPAGPRLVPSIEETGPIQIGGMSNLNAEAYMTPSAPMRMSDDHVMREKYDLLRKFERLGKMGVPMRKRFTIDSPLEEMKLELEFIRREKSMDSTIKQFSEWFVTGMSAAEWGAKNVIVRHPHRCRRGHIRLGIEVRHTPDVGRTRLLDGRDELRSRHLGDTDIIEVERR